MAEVVADYVALRRPLIREPDLVCCCWQSTDSSRAARIACNRC